jgi:hypothetical protein
MTRLPLLLLFVVVDFFFFIIVVGAAAASWTSRTALPVLKGGDGIAVAAEGD